jgi:hypothetical protein
MADDLKRKLKMTVYDFTITGGKLTRNDFIISVKRQMILSGS